MRNRILAGVGVAALATVGLAAPAAADNHDTADLYVVHGIPGDGGFPVDIYADGGAVDGLQGVTFGTATTEPISLPAGTYTIDIVAADAEAPEVGEGLLTLEATLAAGDSVTAVAHLDSAGDPALTPFVNNVSSIEAGEARLQVRHAAFAPAVDVLANGAALGAPFAGLETGDDVSADIPAGAVSATIAAEGSTDGLIDAVDLPLAAGTNTIVHAVGSLDDGVVQFAAITISGLGETPSDIPSGAAGLVAENNSGALVGGAALLIALLAAVGIIARRATVSSK